MVAKISDVFAVKESSRMVVMELVSGGTSALKPMPGEGSQGV